MANFEHYQSIAHRDSLEYHPFIHWYPIFDVSRCLKCVALKCLSYVIQTSIVAVYPIYRMLFFSFILIITLVISVTTTWMHYTQLVTFYIIFIKHKIRVVGTSCIFHSRNRCTRRWIDNRIEMVFIREFASLYYNSTITI